MMGKMVDDMDRKRIITISLIIQNVCVLICAVILYFILPFGAPHPPLGDLRFCALFLVLVLVRSPFSLSLVLFCFVNNWAITQVGSISALASMVEEIAVGRDWVVVITDGDREALTGTQCSTPSSCSPTLNKVTLAFRFRCQRYCYPNKPLL
jgi:hypothetical protein